MLGVRYLAQRQRPLWVFAHRKASLLIHQFDHRVQFLALLFCLGQYQFEPALGRGILHFDLLLGGLVLPGKVVYLILGIVHCLQNLDEILFSHQLEFRMVLQFSAFVLQNGKLLVVAI